MSQTNNRKCCFSKHSPPQNLSPNFPFLHAQASSLAMTCVSCGVCIQDCACPPQCPKQCWHRKLMEPAPEVRRRNLERQVKGYPVSKSVMQYVTDTTEILLKLEWPRVKRKHGQTQFPGALKLVLRGAIQVENNLMEGNAFRCTLHSITPTIC